MQSHYDAQLKDTVRYLGKTLGQTIKAQLGNDWLEKIEKADFLVAKAKEIDEAPVIPVIPVSLPIQPKLPPVGPSPAQTAYDEAETYWKPKKFN